MKQIKINENCDGCGICIVNSNYFDENDEGYPVFKTEMSIRDDQLPDIEKVIQGCPNHALTIVEVGTTKKRGREGCMEIANGLANKLCSMRVNKASLKDVKFDAKRYPIRVPYSFEGLGKRYSSERSARSAATSEFNALCYAESAYRPMIKKVFVEYKVDKLKKYYTFNDDASSYYHKYFTNVREALEIAYAEINELVGDGRSLPDSWKEFDISLDSDEVYFLTHFDNRSTSSGIMEAFHGLTYSSLDDYVGYMDFDDHEVYSSGGFFSRTKYEYSYSGFEKASREFVNDLTWAIDYMGSDIAEAVLGEVNLAIDLYNNKAQKVLDKKLDELNRFISKMIK